MAPDFSEQTKRVLSQRVNGLCSNPGCAQLTSGPHTDSGKSTVTGEAAHIAGARPDAARYDESMTDAERAAPDNGIWLCRNCHRRIDRDADRFPSALLRQWKAASEARVDRLRNSGERPTLPGEVFSLASLPTLWAHEPGEDDVHIARSKEITWLEAQTDDVAVRSIALEGLGGTGKTTLIGHWLAHGRAGAARALGGRFFWSFYIDRDVGALLRTLIDWISARHDVPPRRSEEEPIEHFERVAARLPPHLLVLDGVEVLQHAIDERADFGRFTDPIFHDLIAEILALATPWLVVTTSRFPLADVPLDKRSRRRALVSLERGEALDLLNRLHVRGPERERVRVIDTFCGHPLSLRLFGASLPRAEREAPRAHLENVLGGLGVEAPFSSKLGRLLRFYSDALDDRLRSLLESVSLFRSPVAVSTIETVAEALSGVPVHRVTQGLMQLRASGVLLRDMLGDEEGYSCHPVVRDTFRMGLLGQNAGERAIDVLSDRPDDLGLAGVTDLEPLILVIEALNDAGRCDEAHALFNERLDGGREFVRRALPFEAVRVFDSFINPPARGPSAEPGPKRISRPGDIDIRLRVPAGMFDLALGELASAERRFTRAREVLGGSYRADPLRGLARVAFHRGDLAAAEEYARHAAGWFAGADVWGVGAVKRALGLYVLVRVLVTSGQRSEAKRERRGFEGLWRELDEGDARLAEPMADATLALTARTTPPWERLCRELRANAHS